MQDIHDNYSNPTSHSGPPSDSDERTLPYDCSEQYTNDAKMAEDIQEGETSSGGPIDAFFTASQTGTSYGEEAKERNKGLWYLDCVQVDITAALPKNAAIAKRYFQKLLVGRGCKGEYKLWGYSPWGGTYHNFKFGKTSMCPLCKEVHDGYNFDYKVREGMYGGWKCWKTGEWESHFVIGEYEKLYQ